MDDEKLIAAVQIRPCIFDKSDKNHFNRYMVATAWQNVAKEVGGDARGMSLISNAGTMSTTATVTSASAPARYYSGPRQCIQELIRRGGVGALYRGMGAMAARDIPGYGLYLVVFEYLDHLMHRHGYTDSQGIFSNIVAGGLAGSISWAAILPFDVIKSRIQADEERKYKGFWDCAVRSWQEEGGRVFTRGMLVCSLRGFPSAAVTFLVYSQTLKLFSLNDLS